MSTQTTSRAWVPFRHRLFAAMWTAQFVSNIGSWMQTVAAQWVMLTLTGSAVYVSLVQTASSLPVVIFAVLAGAIGDLVNRRNFLLISQGLMLMAAAALGALALAGLISPWTLLALTFALGSGQAMTSPVWQTLQPELVAPAERQQAISLGSVNQNLARAIGPAIGGALLAATSAGTVFLVNAVSFLAVIGVIVAWRGGGRVPDALPREHLGEAIRAGGRYITASPVLRVILTRALMFIFFASSVWALLPLIAQRQLHLGSGGYGLLLGCVGVGAVAGAVLLPRLRARLNGDGQLTTGSLGLAAAALPLALVHITVVAGIALAFGGAAWILALSTLNSVYQLNLPGWVKARGMSFYLIVFQGGNAVGAAILGLTAEHAGVTFTLLLVTVAPQLADDQTPVGPMQVTVEYRPLPGSHADLMTALRDARFARRRTGAVSWRVWQDSADPDRILEEFVVASWDEHLRQHERVTKRDADRFASIRALTSHPPVVTHWLTPAAS